MWFPNRIATSVHLVHYMGSLRSMSLLARILLPTGILQHWFGCQLGIGSNRLNWNSDQIFVRFPSYLTTNIRKRCGQPSYNVYSMHSASRSATSTIVGRFSSAVSFGVSLFSKTYHPKMGFGIVVDGEFHRFSTNIFQENLPDRVITMPHDEHGIGRGLRSPMDWCHRGRNASASRQSPIRNWRFLEASTSQDCRRPSALVVYQ